MAHPGKLERSVSVGTPEVFYDPSPKLPAIDGLGASVGSRTLVAQRPQSLEHAEEHAVPTVPVPTAPAPQPSRVATWVKWFVDATVVPAINHIGTEWLVSCVPPDYQATVRPLAHLFSATVAKPTIKWLSDHLVDALADPAAFKDNVVLAASDPIATVRAALPAALPGKPELGRAARALIVASSDAAATTLMLDLAARASGAPHLASTLQTLAPQFGHAFRTLFDFGFDVACPMTIVAPADVPKVGDTVTACLIVPATIAKVAGNFAGTHDATVALAAAQPWFALTGTATVTLGQEKRIVGISRLAEATLVIGKETKYRLTGLETRAYGAHTGWSLAAGTMIAVDGAVPATLEHLTISPVGWVDGAFVRDGKPGLLGGKAPDGVQWPLVADAPVAIPELQLSGDRSPLAAGIHTAIAAHRSAWLKRYPMLAIGWATGYANLIKQKAGPEALAAAHAANPTSTWLRSLDPTGLLAEIAAIDLVPSFLRSGYPKLSFNPYELVIGREPSLSFGMTTKLQLFEQIPALGANQVVVAWLPFETPTVRVRADRVAFGEALEVTGLEIDPTGGLRTTHARLAVPMPTETFSLPRITLAADYLTVGRHVDFRSASMTAQALAIGDVVTVESLQVTVASSRYTATVTGGKATVPGVTTLAFDGKVGWGAGRAADGSGTLAGTGLSALDGMITAKALSGTLTVAGGATTGEITAKDFALAWKDYTLKTTAAITVDRHGVAKFSIAALEVWKAGARVGAATNAVYERGKTLTIGTFALDLPEAGELRATKADPHGAAPQLATTDLDLSSLVRKPDEAVGPPTKPTGLAVTNLARLELGPKGTPFLALDFTKAMRGKVAPKAKPAEPGAVSAVVSGDLRRFKIKPMLVEVERSATDERDVRLTLAGIVGNGYSIGAATYDGGVLTVTDARMRLGLLLGDNVPDALRGLRSTVRTSFAIDTRENKLLSLTVNGKLDGKLFGGALTIEDASALLVASPGTISTSSLANGLALSGQITGTVSANAYGVKTTLTGTVAFPTGTAKLSGRGSAGPIAVEVTDVSFGNGKPIFESAKATIAPPVTDLVKFVAWKSKLVLPEEDRGRVVVIAAKKLEVEPESGLPLAAVSEQVAATPAKPSAQALPGREIGVHVPQINIHDGAFVLVAHDAVVPEGPDLKTVRLEAEADLKLGMLIGHLAGSVTMTLPGSAPADASSAKVVATPQPGSIALDVTEATIGGLAMKDLRYEHGRLTVGTATVQTATLLGGFPLGLGLDRLSWTATRLAIDIPKRSVSVEKLATTATDLACLGGALAIASATAEIGCKPSPVDDTSLIPESWALTLIAIGAQIGVPNLSIGGSAKLVIDRTGLQSGELTGGSLRCGVGETSVGKIALTPDGWSAADVTVVLGKDTALGFDQGSPIAGLPTWLDLGTDYQVRAKFPLSAKGKKIVWPTASQIEIDVQKAGLKLPGITGSFERTKTRRTASVAAKPPKGEFKVGLQVPLAHGVGIEISGSLAHEVSLEATDVALAEGDHLGFAGTVAGKAAVKGRLRVGVFGGVPALFTVSAGIYAGLDLSATLAAEASGAWHLPKAPEKDASGAVELYLSLSDPKTSKGAMLTGEAGAYASINVLGFGRTIEKPLAKAEIAEVAAHGFARLETARGLTLLPAGEFPTHVLRLHPKLDELLTGGDTQQAIALAQRTVDRGVGKMQASEELLAAAPAAATGDKPWKPDQRKLEADRADAAAKVAESKAAARTTQLALEGDRGFLAEARKKLANHEKKLLIIRSGLKKTVPGRAVLDGDVATRLTGYERHQGLVAETTDLDAAQLQTKIACKKEEIAELEARIAIKVAADLAKRERVATATNANEKATRKAGLAGKTKGDVEADLAWRQRRLIEMYGMLQAAHKKANDQDARRAGKTVKLAADQRTAEQRIAALKADPDASATELKFWTAQLAFVTTELKRLRTEAAPAPIEMSAEATAAFERAKAAQPAAIEKLSAAVMADLHKYERKIEAITVELTQNFADLDAASESQRAGFEKQRKDLLVALEKAQVKLAGALERAAAM